MDFVYVSTATQLPATELNRLLANVAHVGMDIETTGLDPLVDRPVLLQVATETACFVFDLRLLPKNYVTNILEVLVHKLCIFHNAKFDLKFLMYWFNFKPKVIFDTMLAKYLTKAGICTPYISLKSLAAEYLNLDLDKEYQYSFLAPVLNFSQEQLQYAAQDAVILIPLYKALLKELETLNLITTYTLEFDLLIIVCQMELYGVLIDVDALGRLIQDLELKAKDLELSLFKQAKTAFNPRSPQQVKAILAKLGYLVESTSEDVLKTIPDPFVRTLLDYRETYKLLSSFGKTLLLHIAADGRIHSEFNQLGTSTGRFSSTNINLQNIPASKEFRSLFIASPGCKLVTADFSQIELRLAGILSGEPGIIEEYKKPDADLHRLTASKIFQVPPEEVTKEMRQHGKTGNFSCVYGTSPAGLAAKQGISIKLATQIVDGFWNGYPRLKQFVTAVSTQTLKTGYARTITGRIRWFSLPASTDPAFRTKLAAVTRAAANFVIQGLAADIMKYALVRVAHALSDTAHILLTVHDEMVVEVPEDLAAELVPVIKTEMETAAAIIVNNVLPIPANVVVGDCWIK